MQINEAKVIWIGIGLWAAAFLILLPFRKPLTDDGHGWWLYTCLAGAGLGMVGLPMVGRRKTVMARETERGKEAGREVGWEGARDGGRDGGRDADRDSRRERNAKGGNGGKGGRNKGRGRR